MAFEDLFGGRSEVMAGTGDVSIPETGGFDFEEFFSDPNIIRGLGETGAAISRGDEIGGAVGDFASNLTRRRAVQKGAQASRQREKSFQEQIIDAIRGGKALSPKEQNDAFDNFTLDGDGNVTLSMKNTPQKQGFTRQPPLEAVKLPAPGGLDLPDFSSESGGETFDFAGLDAEDIGMLLKAEQQFGQLNQNQAKMLLNEKARRAKMVSASKNRAATLAQLAEDKKEKIRQFNVKQDLEKDKFGLAENRLKLAELKEKNQEEMNPQELERHTLEMANLQSQIDERSADLTTTPTQQAQIDKTNADLERKETELGLKLDKLEKDEFFSMQPSYVDDKGETVEISFEEREVNANQANNRPNNKVFYHVTQPIEDDPNVYAWGTDVPGKVTPVFLPKHPKTNKQITSQDVIDTARANNISPEEVLRQWGLIK